MENKVSDKERSEIDIAALEKQLAESKLEIANLKHQNKVLMLFVKYGLSFNHYIDQNGNIMLRSDTNEKVNEGNEGK